MKYFSIVIIIVALLVGYNFYQSNKSPPIPPEQADLILFWGDGCPHCKTVEEYIKKEKVESTIKISRLEVYYNKANQKLLSDKASKCPDINTEQGIGVPFAFDNKTQQCLVGDQPIISWLKAYN